MKLWEQLAADPKLAVLDERLHGSWPKPEPNGFRPSFYLCCELIQLIENVYLDLNLEETWQHPDNEGWRTMFKHWAESNEFKTTWAMTNKTYGLRFRYFCGRCLDLPL